MFGAASTATAAAACAPGFFYGIDAIDSQVNNAIRAMDAVCDDAPSPARGSTAPNEAYRQIKHAANGAMTRQSMCVESIYRGYL